VVIIDALDVLFAQLTRDLFVIAKFLFNRRVATHHSSFSHQTGWQSSDGDPLNGGVECKAVRKKNRDFLKKNFRFISEMVQDRAIVTMNGG